MDSPICACMDTQLLAGMIFWLVFVACIFAIRLNFLKKDLNLIASRLKIGPTAEQQSSQKITQAVISVFLFYYF